MFSKEIGIDLGTANIIVYVRGKGVVLTEPSVVAVEQRTKRVLAVGEEARLMIGRTPGHIVATRPLKDGVIADYDVTEMMLKHVISRVCGRHRLFRPHVAICIPSGVTGVEKRAIHDAAIQAGAKKVYLLSEPMAAAIGAGLNVIDPTGNMVIDIGGGTTDVAVISLGSEVVADSIRVGGDDFDEAIVRYLRREYNLVIGIRTAEACKIELASLYNYDSTRTMEVTGRDTVTGLPRSVEINQAQIADALEESVTAIVQVVTTVLERTPPELSADIIHKGMIVTGGGAMLDGFAELIATETGIACQSAEEPMSCVAVGTGKLLDGIGKIENSMIIADLAAGR